MRKICALLVTLIVLIASAKAQYVYVNDGPFKTILMQLYPSCFNTNGDMDTTCTPIITEDSLVIHGPEYMNMVELKYFKSLRYLDVSGNSNLYLTNIPDSVRHFDCSNNFQLSLGSQLPDSLKYFNIANDAFSPSYFPTLPVGLDTLICYYQLNPYDVYPTLYSLPALPPNLRYLDCSYNDLSTFPTLPATLTYFNCAGQYTLQTPDELPHTLATLPPLPAGLQTLICSNNKLSSLPNLPAGLKYLDCTQQESGDGIVGYVSTLSSITSLPNTLEVLLCSRNIITTIPVLPPTLERFVCSSNLLTNLPALPAALKQLEFANNSVTALPALPAGLLHLNLRSNQVSVLPALPGTLLYLDCQLNNITCMPHLPASMAGTSPYGPTPQTINLAFDIGDIKCIPNTVQGIRQGYGTSFTYANTSYTSPLCSPINNVHQCEAFPVVSGYTFYDNNSNGVQDPGELPKPNVRVELSNGLYGFSNNNGYYELSADLGSYTLTVDPVMYYDPLPSSFTHTFSTYDTLVSDIVAMQPNTIVDSMKIVLVPLNTPRPGFAFHYAVGYENVGTTIVNPHIVLSFDNTRLTYTSSSNASVINNGNNLSLDLTGFTPGQQGGFIADFMVPVTDVLGDTVRANVVCAAATDICSDSVFSIIRGSFDPNDKQATPSLTTSQVVSGKYIDYLVRFQNTGNFTATNIVITDTLSGLLQANTLEVIKTSHNCKITQHGNAIVFEFLNIMLPWSSSNETASHGFIRFRVRPQPSAVNNLQIDNKVSIYFDYNNPVLTNTASTIINVGTVPLTLLSFKGYAQPDNTALLNWSTANEINTRSFEIEQSIDSRNFISIATVAANGRGDNSYMQKVNLPAGITYYRLKMIDIDGKFTYSPIVKISVNKNNSGIVLIGNPVKQSLMINVTDKSIYNTTATIINNLGAVVKIVLLKEGLQNIDVGELPAGNYFIKTNTGSQKFIISR